MRLPPIDRSLSKRARARAELIIQTRAQIKFERLLKRALVRVIKSEVAVISKRYEISGLSNIEDCFERIQSRFQEVLFKNAVKIGTTFGQRIFDSLPKGVQFYSTKAEFRPFEQLLAEWARDHTAARAVTIGRDVRQTVNNIVSAQFAQGVTDTRLIANAIKTEMGSSYARWKAVRIAQTETHTASQWGQQEVAKESGIEFQRQWLTNMDGRQRDSHERAHEQFRTIEEPFDIGGSSLMFPGDPDGPAREIINCRCVVGYDADF